MSLRRATPLLLQCCHLRPEWESCLCLILQEPLEEQMSLVGTVLGHGLGQPPVRCCWGEPLGVHPLLHGAPKGAASHRALGKNQPLY